MAKTKYTLAKTQEQLREKDSKEAKDQRSDFYSGPVTLRMRTKEDTELIVTDFQTTAPVHEYILVTIQNCAFALEGEGDDE